MELSKAVSSRPRAGGVMRPLALDVARRAKGFLDEHEGAKLFELALESSLLAPLLEIGSYCGKSSIFLAEACRIAGRHPLICVDHHLGNEEQQPGQPYFDSELYDVSRQCFLTFDHFRRNLAECELLEWVVPIVAESSVAGRCWKAPLALVFIDGGHSEKDAVQDFRNWSPHVIQGGYLCVHDVFPNPQDGGQAPYRMFEAARMTQEWDFCGLFHSLGVLRKL
jgi:predicted O-methyltransferase YrrM